jgi:hypothetical protein
MSCINIAVRNIYIYIYIYILRFRLWWISGVVVLLQPIKAVMLVTVDTHGEYCLAMSLLHKYFVCM